MRLNPMQQRVHTRCARAKTQLYAVLAFAGLAVLALLLAPYVALSPAVFVIAVLATLTQASGLTDTLRDIKRHV